VLMREEQFLPHFIGQNRDEANSSAVTRAPALARDAGSPRCMQAGDLVCEHFRITVHGLKVVGQLFPSLPGVEGARTLQRVSQRAAIQYVWQQVIANGSEAKNLHLGFRKVHVSSALIVDRSNPKNQVIK
jgi:hypothetical protein